MSRINIIALIAGFLMTNALIDILMLVLWMKRMDRKNRKTDGEETGWKE